ncbi:hypothetical protein K431DRAFT_297053 [Polychaeton citri CBS 116435]|uniref:Transcription elongation factor Eaf N-terminal domain-containing protein n=1 Tax=Polychaeton citri CBS 116435 TaxID=1314669 RepID=A0A9P4UMT5_9PEZI|nr:hypothetical protein K431DRAFT_297053 [Polychaeton citri CBS 116435]
MTAAVAHTPLDLRQSGSYSIRLGTSISQSNEAQRWGNIRYNYTPALGNDSSGTARLLPARDGDSTYLSIKDGKDEYKYEGDALDDEDSYVLICHGEGKDREWTLERLGTTQQYNLISTPETQDAEKLADRYPHLLSDGAPLDDDRPFDEDAELEDGEADADNPFDFRHFLKEEALKPQEAPRSTVGTPSLAPVRAASSTSITRPAKKVSAFAPTQKKRKAPAAEKAAPAKRAKSNQAAKAEPVQDEVAKEEVKKSAPKKAASKSSRKDSVPQIRVERKASTRKASFDDQEDSGDLIIEDDDVPTPKQNRSAMSLALHGHLGTGPVSLRSAASSPASRIASPAPEASENLYEFELGGSESPEAAAQQRAEEEGEEEEDDADADADVEDLELPSPARTQTQKGSSSHRKNNAPQQTRVEASFDEDDNEDDEDDLEKQLELAMAGDDEEEVSEEE